MKLSIDLQDTHSIHSAGARNRAHMIIIVENNNPHSVTVTSIHKITIVYRT